MGWSIGFDSNWNRDIGYGVPCLCDHPDCNKEIHRGLSYVCGGYAYGGEHGCGLFFCHEHMYIVDNHQKLDPRYDNHQKCDRCYDNKESFKPKPDMKDWAIWKLTDDSWRQWRIDNQKEALELMRKCK